VADATIPLTKANLEQIRSGYSPSGTNFVEIPLPKTILTGMTGDTLYMWSAIVSTGNTPYLVPQDTNALGYYCQMRESYSVVQLIIYK
jgi:hypothetical protein